MEGPTKQTLRGPPPYRSCWRLLSSPFAGDRLVGGRSLSGFCSRVQIISLIPREFSLDKCGVVAVEQVAPAIGIIGAHVPVCYVTGQVHVALHHGPLAVLRCMMTANGIDRRTVTQKPAVVYAEAYTESLEIQVVDRPEHHQQIADIGRAQLPNDGCRWARELHKDQQSVGSLSRYVAIKRAAIENARTA